MEKLEKPQWSLKSSGLSAGSLPGLSLYTQDNHRTPSLPAVHRSGAARSLFLTAFIASAPQPREWQASCCDGEGSQAWALGGQRGRPPPRG